MYLEYADIYSEQQNRILELGIKNDIDVSRVKNPGISVHLMECLILAESKGYDLNILELAKIQDLSITYTQCLQELLRNNFDISKLIDMDTYGSFIPYNDRQILTICDGLLEGFDLYYFKNINLEFYQMREVIEGLKVNRDDNNYMDMYGRYKQSKIKKFIKSIIYNTTTVMINIIKKNYRLGE